MKTKCRKLGFIASMLAICLLVNPLSVRGAETMDEMPPEDASGVLEVDLDQYVVEDGVLKLFLNQNQGSAFKLTPEMLNVMLGNNEVTTLGTQTFGETNTPVSYKCVVDVSGSMSQDRIDEAKEVIKDLASIKKPADNITITAMGNDLIRSDYMTDPAEIAEKADVLTLTHEDTNLYYAITEELKALKTDDSVAEKRCLIIFSDGADDQGTGITQGEAEKAVEDSHIPIFTVALMKNKDNANDVEMAKILGSFARLSAGGVHFNPALDGTETDTIADSIVGTLNQSYVATESIEDLDVSGKEALLKVTVSSPGGQTASDSITVPESDIKVIRSEQEKYFEEEEIIPATETETESVVEEKGGTILGLPLWLFILLIAVIAAVIVGLLLFFLMRKRKQEEGEEIGRASCRERV